MVAMSSARDFDLGLDAAAVAVRTLRRGRFEPAGIARHPYHRHDSGFGASLAIDDDDTLYVGAPDLNGGAVFVFERSEWSGGTDDGCWQPVAELRAPAPQPAARFGAAIAVSGHGQGRRIVVGEPDRDSRARPGLAGYRAGAAHVFERRGNAWAHTAFLVSPEPGTTARFGSSVAVAGDTIVIGSPGASRQVRGQLLWSCGDAWSVHHVDGQWTVEQRLHPPAPSALAAFGDGVGFDGITIAVTALREPQRIGDPGPPGHRRGVVHLFERAASGWPTDPASQMAPWRPVQRLMPPTADDEHFAASVSVLDGVIAVGAPNAHFNAGHDLGERAPAAIACGAAYVYEKVHANTWVPRTRCTAPDAIDGGRDGAAVTLARRTDGCISVVMTRGGNPEGPPGPGAVHAFTPMPMVGGSIPSRWLVGMG